MKLKKVFIYLAALIGGISLTLEGAIGGVLGQSVGEFEASLFVFVMAFLILSPFLLIYRRNNLSRMVKLPKWQLTGGLFGSSFLVLLFFSVTRLGVGIAMTTVIIGQMLISIVIDHHGWLGAPTIKFNRNRFIAIILLAGSLFLIV